ncbi:hypothetical protein M3J43_24855, partial [Escherichia coli]|nr:hypothetical protein [Escherichia coli]
KRYNFAAVASAIAFLFSSRDRSNALYFILQVLLCFFEWCTVLMHIRLFACACSSSRRVAIRSRFISELQGIDGQASATK